MSAFTCYQLNDGVRGEKVGGADAEDEAVMIACAFFVARQSAAVDTHFGVAVVDSSNALVASVGERLEDGDQ
jgi:hypothetical protein